MADNTTLNVGASGDVIATDDVGGVKYQRNKRALGRDGTASERQVVTHALTVGRFAERPVSTDCSAGSPSLLSGPVGGGYSAAPAAGRPAIE